MGLIMKTGIPYGGGGAAELFYIPLDVDDFDQPLPGSTDTAYYELPAAYSKTVLAEQVAAGKQLVISLTGWNGTTDETGYFVPVHYRGNDQYDAEFFSVEYPQERIDVIELGIQQETISGQAKWVATMSLVYPGGSGDSYTKAETDALLDEKSSFDISTISTAGGGDEVHATVSQGEESASLNYYKDGALPNALNLNVGSDSFRIPTTGYVDTEVAKKGNAKITFDTEYQYLQIRDDNGTDIGFSQETANTVRVQEYAKDSRGQVQPIFDETLASKTYVDGGLSSLDTRVTANTDAMTNLLSRTYATKGAYNSLIQDCDNFIYPDSASATYRVFMQSLEKKGSRNVIDYCYEISFNDGSDSVLVLLNVSEYKFDFGTSVTSRETYEAKDRDGNLVCYFYEVYRNASNGAWGIYFIAPDKNHSAGGSSETLGNRIAQIEAYEPKAIYRVSGYVEEDYGLDDIEDNVTDMQNAIGDLTTLTTTDKTNLVGAINEVDAAVKGLGEPFRVKQWASNTLNVEIPYCTEDIGNGSIAKMIYSIDAVEGADYQIVGMIAYEVFDAESGGNRINCWPVCQFTGNGQKELSVRWMCGGTTRKTAKRINAWVLLKHR